MANKFSASRIESDCDETASRVPDRPHAYPRPNQGIASSPRQGLLPNSRIAGTRPHRLRRCEVSWMKSGMSTCSSRESCPMGA